jgi:PAS domain S-box-containing protein
MTSGNDRGIVLPFSTRTPAQPVRASLAADEPLLKVLVIIDAAADRMVMRSALAASGFALQEAVSGQTGLALASTFAPDCILLDHELPDIDSLKLLDALRGSDGILPCAVVMLAATNDAPSIEAAVRAGAQDFIIKGRIDNGDLPWTVRFAVRQFRMLERQRVAEQRNAELAAIVTTSGDAILSVGLDSVVHTWNPAAEILFGYSEVEAVGRTTDELIVPEAYRAERAQIYAAAREGRQSLLKETVRRHKNGTLIPVEIKASPIVNSSGGVSGVGVIFRDVTERKRAEYSLRESEAFGRGVFESSPDCVKILDLDGRVEEMNDSGRRLMQIDDFAAIRGLPWPTLWPAESRSTLESAMAEARVGRTCRFSAFCPTAKGTAKWWDVAVTAVAGADGQIRRLLAASRDITDRKRTELNLEFLAGLSEAIGTLTSAGDIAQIAAQEITRHFGVSRVNFSDVNESGDEIAVYFSQHSPGLKDDRRTHRLSDYLDRSLIADLRAGRVVAINDVDTDPRSAQYAARYEQWNIRSAMLAPFVEEGHWRFLIVLHKGVPYAWRTDEIDLLREISARVHVRLHRARAEAALGDSEARFRHAVDASGAAVYEVDASATGNSAAEAYGVRHIVGGHAPDEGLDSKWWHAQIHPDDVAAHREHLDRCLADRERTAYKAAYRVRHVDGSWRQVEDTARIRRGPDGGALRLVGIIHDVTEHQAAQQALLAAHDSFRHLVEKSPFGIYAVDAEFRLALISDGAQKVFENVRPLIGRDFAEVLRKIWPEPFASEAIGRFRHTLETGEPYRAPSTVERRADIGEVESYDWKIERVTLPDGRYGVVCHFYDLSERQQHESALARIAERQQLLLDVTGELIAGRNVAAMGKIVFDKIAAALDADVCFTYEMNAATSQLDLIFQRGIPDDQLAAASRLDLGAAFCGTVAALCAPIHADARGIASDPNIAFVHAMGLRTYACHPLRASDGRILGTFSLGSTRRDGFAPEEVGFLQAVANFFAQAWERISAEAARGESDERFRTIVATAQEGIWAVDLHGRTILANPRMADLVGSSTHGLTGKSIDEFCFPEDVDEAHEHIAANFAGQAEEFEFRLRRTDGRALHVLAATAPLKSRDGEIIGALGGFLDLTERKQAEERQRVLMREVAHRGKNLLAVVQSIAGRTLTGHGTLEEARKSFVGRLQALSRTYASLTDEVFEGAPLDEIVASELSSFEGRTRIDGPKIMLGAKVAQTFALIVHELATNAAKYGALSVPAGHLAVTWQIADVKGAQCFLFDWTETGGPPAVTPTSRGFGTLLITTVAGGELKCEPEITYAAEGFRYRLVAPLASIGTSIDDSPVRGKLRSETLRAFYDAWTRFKLSLDRLPDFKQFPREPFASSGGLTVAQIDGDKLRFAEVGQALTERLGRPHDAGDIADEDPDALAEAYLRCARVASPCYEHLRFDFGSDNIVSFERLLLPFSRIGKHVTHIAGLVVYSGSTRANDARESAQD